MSTAISLERSTATRSATRSTSSRLCVDSTMARRSSAQAQDQRARVARAFRIESRGRFVEQDDAGLVEQRARERHALLEPLRQLCGRVARAVANVEEIEGGVDRPTGIGQAVQPRVDHQVLARRQAVPQPRRLGQQADRPRSRGDVSGVDRFAVDARRHRRSARSGRRASAEWSSCRRRSVRAARRSRLRASSNDTSSTASRSPKRRVRCDAFSALATKDTDKIQSRRITKTV